VVKNHEVIKIASVTLICQLFIITRTKLFKPGTAAVQMPSITFNSTAHQLKTQIAFIITEILVIALRIMKTRPTK